MTLVTSIIIISGLFLIIYCIIIIGFTAGWFRKVKNENKDLVNIPFLSVIVAFRNEEANLGNLISHLKAQDYPSNKHEIIFSDDFSQDSSIEIIEKEIQGSEYFRLIKPGNGDKPGKKAALLRAMNMTRGEIIITTDADCFMGKHWLQTIAREFQNNEIKLILGPVDIIANETVFSHFQSLEFMSLTGSAAGSAKIGKPVLANAANLAFRKNAFEEIKSKIDGVHLSSGDDIFLLHAIKKEFPKGVKFLMKKEAVVYTHPLKSIGEFYRQRMRWSAKATSFKDLFTLITGAVVAGLNIFLVAGFFMAFFFPAITQPLLLIWIAKVLIDLPLITGVAIFLKKVRLLGLYIPLQLIYPFYVSSTLLLAALIKSSWKNRK
ncbi:MAG: glycosyltransferase [Bacteroidetes bacterium]|nr:MAG: glycosyltransferase [Bacteroidota bacterium]